MTHECDRQTDGQILPQQMLRSPGAAKHMDRGGDAHARGVVWWLYAHDDDDDYDYDYTYTTAKISLSLDCEENT